MLLADSPVVPTQEGGPVKTISERLPMILSAIYLEAARNLLESAHKKILHRCVRFCVSSADRQLTVARKEFCDGL